jgi:hypothetical protein
MRSDVRLMLFQDPWRFLSRFFLFFNDPPDWRAAHGIHAWGHATLPVASKESTPWIRSPPSTSSRMSSCSPKVIFFDIREICFTLWVKQCSCVLFVPPLSMDRCAPLPRD